MIQTETRKPPQARTLEHLALLTTLAEVDPVFATAVADITYVERLIAADPVLRATRHTVALVDGHVAVEVEGAHWEARAWRHATGGRIRPSRVDTHGVRHQDVIASRVLVHVVDRPAARS